MADDSEFSDAPAETADSELAAVWDGLHADTPHDGTNGQAMPATGPQSWSAPMRQRLSSLPPEYRDVVEYAAQRDKEQHEAISRYGQERKKYEPILNLINAPGLADAPPLEVAKYLEQALGHGEASRHMHQLATEYEQNYQPLRQTLDQFGDVVGDRPAHEFLSALLARERALRTNPAAIREMAKQYGYSLPAAEHVTQLQTELTEVKMRETARTVKEFWGTTAKEIESPEARRELLAEIERLNPQTQGLDYADVLALARQRVLERTGVGKQLEQRREQEQAQKLAERDQQWQTLLAQRDNERMRLERERDELRQREAIERYAREAPHKIPELVRNHVRHAIEKLADIRPKELAAAARRKAEGRA